MRVRSRFGIGTALLLIGLAACADRGGTDADVGDEPRYGGTVVVAGPSDLDQLNSLVTADQFTMEITTNLLFLPLVRYTAELDFEPALAESWEMLGDTGVVFNLRRDVRWHDGRPTTARDVVFTYERAVDPETAFPNASYFGHWTGAAAVDSFTVRFSFRPHLDPLAGLPFTAIMPAHLLDSIPSARLRQAAFNRRPVGNGPFRFVEYRANDRWVFEANEDFPEALGGRPHIDRFVWRVIGEPTAQLVELGTGAVDLVLSTAPQEFQRLSSQPGIHSIRRDGRTYAGLIWNSRNAPLDDPRVRRALTLAIDRQQIIDLARAGNGQVGLGPIGPYHWAYDDSLQPLPFDRDSARALLDAAGLVDRDGDGMRELPDGSALTIELKYPGVSLMSRDVAELTRGGLAAVGVRVALRPVDYNALIGDITSPSRTFQGAVMALASDFRINLRDSFHSEALDGPFQAASYSNPRVDALIDSVEVATDREHAARLYGEIQRLLHEEQPWSYLYYYGDLVLARDRLRGVEMDIRSPFLNVGEWWVTNARPAAPQPDGSADRAPVPDSAPAP